MGGEGVAQRVRTHAPLEARTAGVTLDDLVDALAGQPAAAPVQEDPRLSARAEQDGAPALAVGAQSRDRLAPDRHEALLGALAPRPQQPLLEVDVADVQRCGLRDA